MHKNFIYSMPSAPAQSSVLLCIRAQLQHDEANKVCWIIINNMELSTKHRYIYVELQFWFN